MKQKPTITDADIAEIAKMLDSNNTFLDECGRVVRLMELRKR